jgi:hypothetical protein
MMTQDADNWQLLQDLFHLAEMTPEPDRERVLSERCTDDAVRQRAINIFNASMLRCGHARGDGGPSIADEYSAGRPELRRGRR